MADTWSAAFESEIASKKPIDEQLQSTLSFVQQHEKLLDSINEHNYQHLLSKPEEHHTHTIRFLIDNVERVNPQDLFSIGSQGQQLALDEQFRKILMVFIFLTEEIYQLKDIAESKFYRPLVMFGQLPVEDTVDDDPTLNHTASTAGAGGVTNTNTDNAKDMKSREYKKLIVDLSLSGVKEKMMGQFLPFLQELSNFITRCNAVAVNLIQQLSALYDPKRQSMYRTIFQHSHLLTCFEALSELLRILMSLDCIIQHNDALLDAWNAYKGMIAYIRSDPSTFETSIEALASFEAMVVELDQKVMMGVIFQTCIEQNYEEMNIPLDNGEMDQEYLAFRQNTIFLDGELMYAMKYLIENAMTTINSNVEMHERKIIMGALGLFALYRRLLPSNRPPDMKLYRLVWSIQKVIPSIVVADVVMWNIAEFMQVHCSFPNMDTKKLDPPNADVYRRTVFLSTYDKEYSSKVQILIAQCKAWMILAESRLQHFLGSEVHANSTDTNVAFHQLMDLYSTIFIRGASLMQRTNHMAKFCLNLHSSLQQPLTKTMVMDIFSLLEVLKAMQYTLLRKEHILAELMPFLTRHYADLIYQIITPMKAKLQSVASNGTAAKRGSLEAASCTVMLNALLALEHLLKTSESFSVLRRTAIKFICELILATYTSSSSHPLGNLVLKTEKEYLRLTQILRKFTAILQLPVDLALSSNNQGNGGSQYVTDTSYMYFHVDLLPFMLQAIYTSPTECHRLTYIYRLYEDGIICCHHILHDDNTAYFFHYRTILIKYLHIYVLKPLCRDIETDLRLHVHTKHLDHMQTINPKTENLKPIKSFLSIPYIRLLGLCVEVKQEICHYLNQTFYNLTTIALHDWRTYADMRALALDKYDLNLMDNYLPMGSLDQGLDILQIMRNIHIFVSRFAYNMNMQIFIEFRADATKASKHCNTIQIRSIAASIRQHGLGMLNTTVNYTYQFLSSKFHVFSQFLFDDYIKAYLSREYRHWKKHKHEYNNIYPYARALQFVRDIRKLGLMENKSYLDQFRILITEIGNALGYVRMVRSASMLYCSEAVKYLPEFDDLISFEEYSGKGREGVFTGSNLSNETIRAAKNLDDVIDSYLKNFGEGSDYFKILVQVFQSVLLTDEHEHLKYFSMIIPAMCISWIDASMLAKDAMYKIGRANVNMKEMYFTDDGFAMGIAYCLAILKQTKKFEALHFSESVNQKLKEDSKNLQAQQEKRAAKEAAIAKKKEEKARRSSFFSFGSKKKEEDDDDDVDDYQEQEEIHTIQTTGKKLEAFRRESEQLFYSLSGAEIFFKRTDNDT